MLFLIPAEALIHTWETRHVFLRLLGLVLNGRLYRREIFYSGFFRGGQLCRPAISQGHLLSDSIIVGFPSKSAVRKTGGKRISFELGHGDLNRMDINPIRFHIS